MDVCKQYLNQLRKNTIDFYYCIQNPKGLQNLSVEKFHEYYIIHDGYNKYALYRVDDVIPLKDCMFTFPEIEEFKKRIIKDKEWV
jgi:hypothetical protein